MNDVKSLLLPMLLILILVPGCATTATVPVAPPSSAIVESTGVAPATTAPQAPDPTEPAEPLAVVVNGQTITLAEYERQVALYEASMVAAGQDPKTPEGQVAVAQGRQWVLDLMIGQVLTEQAAAAQGVSITDADVDASVSALRQEVGEEALNDWLAQEGITLAEMRERLRDEMISTEMANRIADSAVALVQDHVHARHILVATEEEARRIRDQLVAGADFASTARTYSQDISTRDLGGDLGFFPMGVLTSKEVEAAAFGLQPGQLSEVVASELGFHIVQVVERVNQEISPENLYLLRELVAQNWLDGLRASADIQVFVTP